MALHSLVFSLDPIHTLCSRAPGPHGGPKTPGAPPLKASPEPALSRRTQTGSSWSLGLHVPLLQQDHHRQNAPPAGQGCVVVLLESRPPFHQVWGRRPGPFLHGVSPQPPPSTTRSRHVFLGIRGKGFLISSTHTPRELLSKCHLVTFPGATSDLPPLWSNGTYRKGNLNDQHI